jgi:hypothetical protein
VIKLFLKRDDLLAQSAHCIFQNSNSFAPNRPAPTAIIVRFDRGIESMNEALPDHFTAKLKAPLSLSVYQGSHDHGGKRLRQTPAQVKSRQLDPEAYLPDQKKFVRAS